MNNGNMNDWPKKSDFCRTHSFELLTWSLWIPVLFGSFFTVLVFPTWYFHLVCCVLLLIFFANVMIRLYDDHQRIVRLRRMYEEYFDFCVAQKRLNYQLEQKMRQND